jgi:uncharacterized protein (TIGR00369 family)
MQTLPHTHSCFVCGESNAQGLKLRFQTDGATVRTEFVPREEHIGFKGTVHGGLIATVLDEVMAWACAVGAGRFAFCAEMNVRFLCPLRPGMTTTATAKLEHNKKDRIYLTSAEVHDASGVTLATASGKYLPIKADELKGMLDELVGETDGFDFASVPGQS